MSQRPPAPPFARKSSTPWNRLRSVKQDPLDTVGFVSKGDSRLLDVKLQRSFFEQINTRYMQFCARHSKDIDDAFASLSSTRRSPPVPIRLKETLTNNTTTTTMTTPSPQSKPPPTSTSTGLSSSRWASRSADMSPLPPTSSPSLSSPPPSPSTPSTAPADELSTILTALRKLREGLLATSATAPSPRFAQQVHVFNIRLAILAQHPESYHPSLAHLLKNLHTQADPLSRSELNEMTTYMILDLALRQDELVAAYTLRHHSKKHRNYEDAHVDTILRAVVSKDWPLFWRVYRRVSGYVRALLHWHFETLRRATLKAFGRAYMSVDLTWLLNSTSDGQLNWEELVREEGVGWLLEGQRVVIRKPKAKP